jgi:alpha-tubulin suppressor-like RCC1 family protein
MIAHRLTSQGFYWLFNEIEVTELLRCILHRETSFNLTTYNRKKLEYLSIFEQNKGRLAGGYEFYLFVAHPDRVYSWGCNQYGQLGSSAAIQITKPRVIPGLTNIKAITVGMGHSLALNHQGQVYSFGFNKAGQLGLGHNQDVTTPTLITGLEKITAIFAQNHTSLALTTQGKVYMFGVPLCEIGNSISRVPKLIEIEKIVTLSMSSTYCLFLDQEGDVFGAGSNTCLRLGFVENSPLSLTKLPHLKDIIEIQATDSFSFFLDKDGTVFLLGYLDNGNIHSDDRTTILPIPILKARNIISIIPLRNMCLVLNNQGELWRLDDFSSDDTSSSSSSLWAQDIIAIQYLFDRIGYLSLDRQGRLKLNNGISGVGVNVV